MRVIGGIRKRYRLYSPRNDKIRPTSDMIKETLFNLLGDDLEGCVFWDLFSGTGQIGIEAISRGAKISYFLEKDKDALKLINENLSHVQLSEFSRVIPGPVISGIKKIKDIPDIIFMDPPYREGLYEETFKALFERGLNTDTKIIAEAPKDFDFSFTNDLGFVVIREKIYKSTKHVFFKLKGE